MKKITLALLAAVCSVSSSFAQANYVLVAPANNNSTSQFRAPNGSQEHAFQRTVMYIHPYELLPMNLATINSFSFQLVAQANTASTGNFTVWLSNTNDFEYFAGTNFNTIISGMGAPVYVGPLTIPGGTGAATVGVALTNPFNYTGNGLYVAYDYDSPGPFATSAATYACNNTEVWCATAQNSVAPVPNTLGYSNFRPSIIWNAVNTATNEVEIITMDALGKVAKVFNQPQTITAEIVNSSIGAQSNVSVALSVTGPNPYTNTVVVPSMAAGSFTTVSFNGFNPTALGLNQMSVSVILPNDQDASNNTKVWTQSVTCESMAQHPTPTTFTNAYGFTGGSGYWAVKHTAPGNASLTSIRANIGAATQNNNQKAWGAIIDASGSIIATSINTINLTTSAQIATFNFTPEAVIQGNDYYFAVAQPTSGYYPMAWTANYQSVKFYYNIPIAGGPVTANNTGGYFGIEPQFTFDGLEISVSASKLITCKSHTPAMTTTLTATGADTYAWTGVSGAGSSSVVVVTPTVGGAAGNAVFTVIGNYTTGANAGCKSAAAVITVSVINCSALMDEAEAERINLYPNPTVGGKTLISGLNGSNSVVVYNAIGQMIIRENVTSDSITIDLSNQPAGNYLVRVTNSNEQSKLIKLIKD